MTDISNFGDIYADVDIYDRHLELVPSETSQAPHPHLQGMDDGRFFCVRHQGATYGPYLTRAAARSLIPEIGGGSIEELTLL